MDLGAICDDTCTSCKAGNVAKITRAGISDFLSEKSKNDKNVQQVREQVATERRSAERRCDLTKFRQNPMRLSRQK